MRVKWKTMSRITRRTLLTASATAPLLRPEPAWERYKHAIPFDLRIPSGHPYLALTPEMIRQTRERAARVPAVHRQLDRLVADADALIVKPWNAFPPRGDVQ